MSVKRVDRLAQQIQQELSDILIKGMKDPRIGFVSITGVRLSKDLKYARIFVSVYGSDEESQQTMAALERAKGFLRTELGQRISVRHIPELTFLLDHSIEQGAKINEILSKLPELQQDANAEDEDETAEE